VKLRTYLELIHGGICSVCSQPWATLAELRTAVVAQPWGHRLSMAMPQGYVREKGSIGDVGVKTR
jgi:hypothetical protein